MENNSFKVLYIYKSLFKNRFLMWLSITTRNFKKRKTL